MAKFPDYATKYQTIRMERRNGILQMTFHTEGGSLRWGLLPHREFTFAFADIGSDPENKVIIMTGIGEEFSGPRPTGQLSSRWQSPRLGSQSIGKANICCRIFSTSKCR